MEDDWETLEGNHILVRKRAAAGSGTAQLSTRKRWHGAKGHRPATQHHRRQKPFGGSAPHPVLWQPTKPPPDCGPTVHLASDCSGLNSANIALQLLGFQVVDEFASEKDDLTRKVLQFNFAPKRLYADMMSRNDSTLPKTLTLYAAGPPCQSFSIAGLNRGLADHRGIVFLRVLLVIAELRPKTFLLENVAGLRTQHKEVYNFILDFLQHLRPSEAASDKLYKVRAKVLDTRCHGGLPQSRPRLFIVGWKRAEEHRPFAWPGELKCRPLHHIIEDTAISEFARPPSPTVQKNITTAVKRIKQEGGDPDQAIIIIYLHVHCSN